MAVTDYIITDGEIRNVYVQKQPTVLQGSPEDNKGVFDAFPTLIVQKFNAALNEIARDTSAEIDRDVLEYYMEIGWTPENV